MATELHDEKEAIMTGPVVRMLGPAESDQGIATVVLAFAADPIMRWFYPDAHQYWTYAPRLIRAFAGRAFEHGTAFGIDGNAAAALWLPPGVSVDDEAMNAVVEESISAEEIERTMPFVEQQVAFHPHEPHWYLPLIGVDPAKQGLGYGSALLQHALALVDEDGLMAYLESTSPGSKALYARFGFEAIGVIQGGDSPPMWPMVRQPRS